MCSRFKGNRQIEPCYFESLATDIKGEIVFGGQFQYFLDTERIKELYIDNKPQLTEQPNFNKSEGTCMSVLQGSCQLQGKLTALIPHTDTREHLSRCASIMKKKRVTV